MVNSQFLTCSKKRKMSYLSWKSQATRSIGTDNLNTLLYLVSNIKKNAVFEETQGQY